MSFISTPADVGKTVGKPAFGMGGKSLKVIPEKRNRGK
jgi:hypothetical protein